MKIDIVRAWKDLEYRQTLNDDELALLPENPVGEIELSDAELAMVQGAGAHKGHTQVGNSYALVCVNSGLILAYCNSYGAHCSMH
jgi:mersacidin/lichenicidin family type 2 lantibiotic